MPLSLLLLVRAEWTSTQAGSQASSRPQTRGPSLVACAVPSPCLPHSKTSAVRVCDRGLNGPLQLVHWDNWRKSSRRDWRAAVDCHCVHARAVGGSRPPAYPVPWASFFTPVTNNCLRLFFFLRPPSVCVCVCVRVCVTDCENAGRSRDDSTTRRPHHDKITTSTSQTTTDNLPPRRPRLVLVLVPPWVAIEFGPCSRAISSRLAAQSRQHICLWPYPFAHPNSVHALAAYRAFAPAHTSPPSFFTPYTPPTVHSILQLRSTALFSLTTRTTHGLRHHRNYCGANLV